MRFLCCCCCRRRSVDENDAAGGAGNGNMQVMEAARSADSDSDSVRRSSLDEFDIRDNPRMGRSPSDALPAVAVSSSRGNFSTAQARGASTHEPGFYVPLLMPSPPTTARTDTAVVHNETGKRRKENIERVPFLMPSPLTAARTDTTSTAAVPLKTANAGRPGTTLAASVSTEKAKAASTANTAAAAASVPQGNAKATNGAAASVPQGNTKAINGAAASVPQGNTKAINGAAASVPQGNTKATNGAAASVPQGNTKATNGAASSAPVTNENANATTGATVTGSAPQGNSKTASGAKAKTVPPKAAGSTSAASVPQKSSKASPTESAAPKPAKASSTASKASSAVTDATVCASLLSLINQLRISDGANPLRLCDLLRHVALSAWKVREAAKDGLAVMPNCQTGFKPKVGEPVAFDCLSYLDMPLHSKEGLPAAAMHFWTHSGSYKTNSGQRPMQTASAFPAAGSPARQQLDDCKARFMALLRSGRNTRVYLHLARTRQLEDEADLGNQPLAVVAVFAPDDAKL